MVLHRSVFDSFYWGGIGKVFKPFFSFISIDIEAKRLEEEDIVELSGSF